MSKLWKKIDRTQQFPIQLDRESDECFFAREYIAPGNYQASDGNSLISNFKKGNDRKGLPEWQHKERAISQFAHEVATAFNGRQFTVAVIPTSKLRNDPNYDSRFDEMLIQLKNLNPATIIEEPIQLTQSTPSVSKEGGTRRADILYNSLIWKGFFNPPPDVLIVIDDVITTGGHFAAYKKLILEKYPNIRIIGMFWAMTVWQNKDKETTSY